MTTIESEIKNDIAQLRASQRKIDQEAARAQRDYYKAEDKAERTGKPTDHDEAVKLHRRLTKLLSSGTAISEKIQALDSASEVERREQAARVKEEKLAKLQELRDKQERDRAAEAGSVEGPESASTDRPRRGRRNEGGTMAAGKDKKGGSKIELARESAVKVITDSTEPLTTSEIVKRVMKLAKVKESGMSEKTIPVQLSVEARDKDARIVRVDRGTYASKDLAATLKSEASTAGKKQSTKKTEAETEAVPA